MLPEERDAAHLWDMLSAAREVRTMLQGVSLEQFQSALIVMRATERCIEIIGEAARRVSKTTQQLQTEIPWSDLIGQRNIWLTNMARSITSCSTKQPQKTFRN